MQDSPLDFYHNAIVECLESLLVAAGVFGSWQKSIGSAEPYDIEGRRRRVEELQEAIPQLLDAIARAAIAPQSVRDSLRRAALKTGTAKVKLCERHFPSTHDAVFFVGIDTALFLFITAHQSAAPWRYWARIGSMFPLPDAHNRHPEIDPRRITEGSITDTFRLYSYLDWHALQEASAGLTTERLVAGEPASPIKLSAAEQDLIDVIREIGQDGDRSQRNIMAVLNQKDKAPSEGTTKTTLAALVRHGILLDGYRLPEWD